MATARGFDTASFHKFANEAGFIPDGKGGFFKPSNKGLSPDPERPARNEPLEEIKAESACAGSFEISIDVYRFQPADRDNEYATAKIVCDALRYLRILTDDDHKTLSSLICTPKKATTKAEERTEIIIRKI